MKSPACCCCPARHRPRGVALITVLLIVFIASLAATSLASLQQLAIRRSSVLLHQQQARLYTLGAEQWLMLLLHRDRQDNQTDHLGETWANPPAALPLDEGTLTLKVRDLQGCFNLNNLWRPDPATRTASTANPPLPQDQANPEDDTTAADKRAAETPNPDAARDSSTSDPNKKSPRAGLDKQQMQILQRLLRQLELKEELALAIADWIDPDNDPQFPDGAEDSDYTVRDPAYLTANQPFFSISELRLVKGIDDKAYMALAPLVCALPPGTPLNINTAPAAVLAALGEDLNPQDMAQLVKERPEAGYDNIDAFLQAARLSVDASIKALLSTSSQYFQLHAEAQVGDGRAMLYSMLQRDETTVHVLQRNFSNPD